MAFIDPKALTTSSPHEAVLSLVMEAHRQGIIDITEPFTARITPDQHYAPNEKEKTYDITYPNYLCYLIGNGCLDLPANHRGSSHHNPTYGRMISAMIAETEGAGGKPFEGESGKFILAAATGALKECYSPLMKPIPLHLWAMEILRKTPAELMGEPLSPEDTRSRDEIVGRLYSFATGKYDDAGTGLQVIFDKGFDPAHRYTDRRLCAAVHYLSPADIRTILHHPSTRLGEPETATAEKSGPTLGAVLIRLGEKANIRDEVLAAVSRITGTSVAEMDRETTWKKVDEFFSDIDPKISDLDAVLVELGPRWASMLNPYGVPGINYLYRFPQRIANFHDSGTLGARNITEGLATPDSNGILPISYFITHSSRKVSKAGWLTDTESEDAHKLLDDPQGRTLGDKTSSGQVFAWQRAAQAAELIGTKTPRGHRSQDGMGFWAAAMFTKLSPETGADPSKPSTILPGRLALYIRAMKEAGHPDPLGDALACPPDKREELALRVSGAGFLAAMGGRINRAPWTLRTHLHLKQESERQWGKYAVQEGTFEAKNVMHLASAVVSSGALEDMAKNDPDMAGCLALSLYAETSRWIKEAIPGISLTALSQKADAISHDLLRIAKEYGGDLTNKAAIRFSDACQTLVDAWTAERTDGDNGRWIEETSAAQKSLEIVMHVMIANISKQAGSIAPYKPPRTFGRT